MDNNKLKYERVNNSDNVVSIDLHNGYSAIAVSGWWPTERCYHTSFFLKDNNSDDWHMLSEASDIKFNADYKTINSAILKQTSVFLYEGFFDRYIKQIEYEVFCFNVSNDLVEKFREEGMDYIR